MDFGIGFGATLLGIFIAAVGHYSLFVKIKTSIRSDTDLTVTAIKSAYTLVIGGLTIIILGLLYLMGIIPWYQI